MMDGKSVNCELEFKNDQLEAVQKKCNKMNSETCVI